MPRSHGKCCNIFPEINHIEAVGLGSICNELLHLEAFRFKTF